MGSNFGKNLRKELNYQGIIIKELSAQTGIPVATLDCYLRTQATEPSAENAVKIAQALRVSAEYLVIGEDTSRTKSNKPLRREVFEIIRWVESLNTEQCKALLRLLKTLRI